MIYLERVPEPRLRPFMRILWYARVPQPTHARERVLPTGCAQVILNLARDFLTDCPEDGPARPSAPMLVAGPRSVYEIVDTSDMADLIGIVFEPGGFPLFVRDRADLFSNSAIDIEQVWGGSIRALRDRLRELESPCERLNVLELWLIEQFGNRVERLTALVHPGVAYALEELRHNPAVSIASIAQRAGWSERRVSQLFREQVGLTPKVWQRLQRFQGAVRRLHAGTNISWAELALECGFYDQSHFANEFRAFSGLNVATYSGNAHAVWANHVRMD